MSEDPRDEKQSLNEQDRKEERIYGEVEQQDEVVARDEDEFEAAEVKEAESPDPYEDDDYEDY